MTSVCAILTVGCCLGQAHWSNRDLAQCDFSLVKERFKKRRKETSKSKQFTVHTFCSYDMYCYV